MEIGRADLFDARDRLNDVRELVFHVHLLRDARLEVSGVFQGIPHEDTLAPRHFHFDSQRLTLWEEQEQEQGHGDVVTGSAAGSASGRLTVKTVRPAC